MVIEREEGHSGRVMLKSKAEPVNSAHSYKRGTIKKDLKKWVDRMAREVPIVDNIMEPKRRKNLGKGIITDF